ncbi:hypothetical protein TWF481_008860 [Arthrobotrys musiformis]|uniref:F-box domain-containing protein n=1 Tax=Arthrobotrys musiformis TaxID=47236 RepID=A0AAV9W9D8_9PEZI
MAMPRLPPELHLQILHFADITQLPVLAQVCRSWRQHILHSPTFLPTKYTYFTPDEPDGHKPVVYFHRFITYITHFIRFEDGGRVFPCYVEFTGDNDGGSTTTSAHQSNVDILNILRDVPVANLTLGCFSTDPILLMGEGRLAGHLSQCLPSPPEYLDIGHPSILWKLPLEPFSTTSENETSPQDQGCGEEDKLEEDGAEGRGNNLRSLLRVLSDMANRRFVARPQNGSAPTMVVRVVPELHEYKYAFLDAKYPDEIQFASMPEYLGRFEGGRVKAIIRFLV